MDNYKLYIIVQILELIITLCVCGGGVFALVKYLHKTNKEASKYEVRCRLAAEFLKSGVVDMKPEQARELFIKILEGKLETRDKQDEKKKAKIADKVIKAAGNNKVLTEKDI